MDNQAPLPTLCPLCPLRRPLGLQVIHPSVIHRNSKVNTSNNSLDHWILTLNLSSLLPLLAQIPITLFTLADILPTMATQPLCNPITPLLILPQAPVVLAAVVTASLVLLSPLTETSFHRCTN